MGTEEQDRANDMMEALGNQRNNYANEAVLLHAQVKALTRKLEAAEALIAKLEAAIDKQARANGHAEAGTN